MCCDKIFCQYHINNVCNTLISSDNCQLYICSVTAAAIFLSINGVATFKAMHFLFKDTLWYKMCITWRFFCNIFAPPSLTTVCDQNQVSVLGTETNNTSISICSGAKLFSSETKTLVVLNLHICGTNYASH